MAKKPFTAASERLGFFFFSRFPNRERQTRPKPAWPGQIVRTGPAPPAVGPLSGSVPRKRERARARPPVRNGGTHRFLSAGKTVAREQGRANFNCGQCPHQRSMVHLGPGFSWSPPQARNVDPSSSVVIILIASYPSALRWSISVELSAICGQDTRSKLRWQGQNCGRSFATHSFFPSRPVKALSAPTPWSAIEKHAGPTFVPPAGQP